MTRCERIAARLAEANLNPVERRKLEQEQLRCCQPTGPVGP